jgi:sugar diacid utilization regulator
VAQAPESSEARGAPQATSANRLADRVAWSLLQLGDDVRVGISADVPSTALVARALREGQLALDQAGAKARIVKYSEIPLRQLLLQVAGEQVCSALPAWTEALLSSDARSKHKLSATLRQYADADMNVLQAAKALGVHPNTIYARMQRIRDITGQDPTRFHALTELLLAIDCAGV